jgi:hypothetical protein
MQRDRATLNLRRSTPGTKLILAAVLTYAAANIYSSLSLPFEERSLSVPFEYELPIMKAAMVVKNSSMITDWKGCSPVPVSVPHDTLIPIFILSRDRLNYLRHAIQSYNHTISSPYEVIVLDHHSTYPPMLDYLRELNSSGTRVLHLQQHLFLQVLDESADIINGYLDDHPEMNYYVYTDSDIALERTAPDVLLFYAGILNSCPELKVVGPHLQISDIPSSYSKHELAVETHAKFWTKIIPQMATWNGIGYHFSNLPIDTTFSMRRRGQRFARLTDPCVRTFAPYAAVHVDWYTDDNNTLEDKMWYLNHSEVDINHW